MIETEGLLVEENSMKKSSLVVIIVCAFLSVIFARTGFLSLFFLAPLGYAVLVCNSVMLPLLSIVSVNAGCLIAVRLFSGGGSGSIGLELLYFTTLFIGFAWIMSEARLRTAYRFILASAAGTVVFLIYINSHSLAFYLVFSEMSEMLTSVFVNSAGIDPARQMITPERVMEAIRIFLLRGGAFISTAFVFFVNRYAANKIFALIKKQKKDRGLIAFFAPSKTIWVLSISLAVILLTRMFRAQTLEILAWNTFVISAIIFFAQGAGIISYFLSRRAFTFRILFSVLIVMAILSPGLNMLAVCAVLLLGILENWLPLRLPKEGQASTPGQ